MKIVIGCLGAAALLTIVGFAQQTPVRPLPGRPAGRGQAQPAAGADSAAKETAKGTAKDTTKPGRVEGVVLSTKGEPVAGAQVTLGAGLAGILSQALASGQGGGQGNNGRGNGAAAAALLGGDDNASYDALTDGAGKFVIENIKPRHGYMLAASKTGYVPARYGARSQSSLGVLLNVDAGEELANLKVTMEEQGTVGGKVLDQFGDPIQGATLMLQRRAYQNGVRTLQPVGTATTDDRGAYRMASLPPGRYYLRASPPAPAPGLKEVPLATYYPNALELRRATALDLSGGGDMSNINIQVQHGAVFTVSGKVMDSSGGPAANALVLPAPQGADIASELTTIMANIQQRLTRPDGTFAITGMPAGSYDVMAIDIAGLASALGGGGRGGAGGGRGAGSGAPTMRLGIGTFYVTSEDVKDVVLTIGNGASVSGTVRLEGGELAEILPKSEAPQNPLEALIGPQIAAAAAATPEVAELLAGDSVLPVSVGLTGSAASLLRGAPAGAVQPDGTFSIESVPPGSYQVSVGSLPPNVYAKSIKYDDKDALANGVDVGVRGSGKLQIVLAQGAATASAVVKSAKGEPELGVTVALWTEANQLGAANHGVHTATTNRDGVAKFSSLAPGTYYVAAFENVDPTLALVRDFVAKLQADATKVEVSEGGKVTKDLKMIPTAKSAKAEDELE